MALARDRLDFCRRLANNRSERPHDKLAHPGLLLIKDESLVLMQRVVSRILFGLIASILLLATPDEGLASCGDWLADSSESMVDDADHLNHAELEPATVPISPLPTQPCTGPECRQQPSSPQRPVPIETTVKSNQALQMMVGRMFAAETLLLSVGLSDDVPLSGFTDTLERPPQAIF